MAKVIEIVLGGRKLRQVVRSSVKHDLWLMNAIRRSGIKEITMGVGERAEDFAQRLLDTLVKSESVTPLISGCFVDEKMNDLEWSPSYADELGKFISELSDPKDKSQLFEIVVNLVVSFFETGVVSLMTSLNSSKRDQTLPLKNADVFSSPPYVAGTPTMESLKTQSGQSP